jgi:hypothetical protein
MFQDMEDSPCLYTWARVYSLLVVHLHSPMFSNLSDAPILRSLSSNNWFPIFELARIVDCCSHAHVFMAKTRAPLWKEALLKLTATQGTRRTTKSGILNSNSQDQYLNLPVDSLDSRCSSSTMPVLLAICFVWQ